MRNINLGWALGWMLKRTWIDWWTAKFDPYIVPCWSRQAFQCVCATFQWFPPVQYMITNPTKWPMRPAKAQISMGICPGRPSLIRVFAMLGSWGPIVSSCGQRRLWSSDHTGQMPRLIWVFAGWKGHFVGFVVRRLIYIVHENVRLHGCAGLPGMTLYTG